MRAELPKLTQLEKKAVFVSSFGLTDEHSVNSGQEQEDQGQGVATEESYGQGQGPHTVLPIQRVDEDEAAPQDQCKHQKYGDEEGLVEVVRQAPRSERQCGAGEQHKKVVHQK